MFKRIAFSLLLVCLASGVIAQDAPTVYTYAAHWNVPRASWGAFTTDNGTNALLDRLVADGTLIWWSNIERFVHAVDSTTHGTMWAATSMAGIERTLEELAKLPAGPAIPDIEHHDHLFLSLMHGGKSASESGGYVWMTINQTVPGQGGRWLDLQRKYYEPVYKTLRADGTILAYDISREYVHANNPRNRFTFIITPDADARGKIGAALAAVRQENAPALLSALRETNVRSEHRDVLFQVAKYTHK